MNCFFHLTINIKKNYDKSTDVVYLNLSDISFFKVLTKKIKL